MTDSDEIKQLRAEVDVMRELMTQMNLRLQLVQNMALAAMAATTETAKADAVLDQLNAEIGNSTLFSLARDHHLKAWDLMCSKAKDGIQQRR